MNIGDIVQNGRHVGVLVEINSNGICKISSSNVNSIATLNNLRFIRSAEESKLLQKELEEEAKRKEQERLLRQEKEKRLQKECEEEAKRKEQERQQQEALRKEQERLLRQEKENRLQKEREEEAKRLRLHQESLRKEREVKRNELFAEIRWWIADSDFKTTELFYYKSCSDFITQDEFKKELENHLILRLKNSIIEADNLFFNQKTISKSEYEHLKSNEVKSFLQNLHIPLNDEQINAIGAIDKNVLLKARAGSGKTSVVTARTFFLIHHEHIHRDFIMLLAFNKKAAEEMESRIKKYGELDFKNARTFHSLAFQLVKPKENLLFDESNTGLSNQRQSLFIQDVIKNAIDDEFKQKMYKFFREETDELNYLGEFLSKDDYLIYRRNHQQITLRGDHVKSLGCKYIGDFLFEHGVKHRYRYVWYWLNGGKGNYRPDFTVLRNVNIPTIIFEHWEIDENNFNHSVPEYWKISWLGYKANMDKKREHWKLYNQKNPQNPVYLIETSIADLQYGRDFFENSIRSKLSNIGIFLNKLDDEELYKRLDSIYLAKMTSMFMQFIQKAKKQRLSPDDLAKKINHIRNERIRTFSELANNVYTEYSNELIKTKSIDFDDLIERAIKIIHNTHGNCEVNIEKNRNIKLTDIKYLMIDEYQDFSLLFFELINSIRTYNKEIRLFCVGDDWQAINAFAGSNLRYFNNFNQYIDASEHKSLLKNFRSLFNIVEFANYFMRGKGEKAQAHNQHNGLHHGLIYKCYTNRIFIEQRFNMSDSVRANFDKRFFTLIEKENGEIINYDSKLEIGRILKACHSIITQNINIGKKVGILSRKTQLSSYYNSLTKFKRKLKETCLEYPAYNHFDDNIHVGTTHSYKGREADIIIMLNVNQGDYPTIHPDEELYEVFGITSSDVLEEEKRLFYVGVTRAKEELYILCEEGVESNFLDDMQLIEYEVKYQF